jgi:hypothetical protein
MSKIEVKWTIHTRSGEELKVWWPAEIIHASDDRRIVEYAPFPPHFLEKATCIHHMINDKLLRDLESESILQWRFPLEDENTDEESDAEYQSLSSDSSRDEWYSAEGESSSYSEAEEAEGEEEEEAFVMKRDKKDLPARTMNAKYNGKAYKDPGIVVRRANPHKLFCVLCNETRDKDGFSLPQRREEDNNKRHCSGHSNGNANDEKRT